MSVYEPDVVRRLLSALEPKNSQKKFEASWNSAVKKCVESWTGRATARMTNPRPRRQYEWEAEIVEYINYISDKTRTRSTKALARLCLDSKVPILSPCFLPPSYLHAWKRNQSEPAINPETLYLKALCAIHPFYYPELVKCPRCNGTDNIQWDGWTGTGPRDVHGLMVDEAAIGTQLRCENCKNDATRKEHEHSVKTNLKGYCFATTNPDFWGSWPHWSIPGDIPVFFHRCAVTRDLFNLLVEMCPSSTAGSLAENIRQLHLLEYHRRKLSYLQAWKSRRTMRHGMDFFSPNPLRLFSDPYDVNNYNDKPISNDVVSEVFQDFVSATWESESEEYLRTLSGVSISFDNTFRAATKATVTSREKKKSRVLKGGIISLMNENSEIVGWISELLQGLKTRCGALDVPPPEIFVADNCCHVRSAVVVVFPGATMKLDMWHFIMRYATVILNPSKNPHRKEVVTEVSACILKKHAEGGSPAEYWDRHEQETRLTSVFEKWSREGTVWSAGARKVHEEQLKHVHKGCLERPRQDIRTDGSRVEGSHKGWNSLQRVHTSGIVTFTGLCHDFVLRRNIRVAFSRATKSDFLSSTHGSHHVHLVDGIAKLFNHLRLEEKTISACCLPLAELQDVPSNEHFGLVESSFASTFGGLLDVKAEEDSPIDLNMSGNKLLEALGDDGDAVDLVLRSTMAEILEEFDINPWLLSMPEAQAEPLLVHPHATPVSSIGRFGTDAQPQAMTKGKADDDTIVISDSEADELPPRKIMWHMTAATSPEVAALQCQLPAVTPSSTPPNPVAGTIALTPIPRPPGMTLSQHFFTIATRIDARAMHISSNVEFHLFMDMRAEFAWISFKMTPKQWAAATETYNNRLEEKNRANGSETVKKNPQALLRKLGEIEVAVMNHVAKNDFKSCSGSETFWRRHCHVIELIKAESGLGKKIRKAHTCSRCKTIMYPGPENSGYNHRWGFCADGAKQVSKTEPPPPWPQPPGIFSEGKHFHPRAFLETVKQIYEQVFLWPSGESPALEQEAFATMLLDRSTTLEESGTVLFKLYEELEIDSSTPYALLTVHNGVKHLCIEYLQEHWAS
ncbi:hypothetical protein EV702DRAFT_1049495 [Suillus placidus]|uniref:Uncharacterized protein n=1 Tax=Suillus placidus TaxID=48579 RepID=A0A9P6ZKA2_9AGAM|nr:hypothetical protein EV702DRAFT_1049495 [Suillus placidus]